MKKPVAPDALPLGLDLLAQMNLQISTVEKMKAALISRRDTLEEFIYANLIGDRQAFDILKPTVVKGNARRFYSDFAHQWIVKKRVAAELLAHINKPERAQQKEDV